MLGRPSPEATRKLTHLGAGVGCVALPFLIRSPWVALVLAAGMTALCALSSRHGLLPALHRVDRRTRGSEYYPVAVFLLFLVARDRPAIYVSAVLVLAVADASAAIVGVRWGRTRYEVEEARKSAEGSAAFLAVALAAIFLPLLLMTELGPLHAALCALLVAALVTLFEAVSLSGADNLFVPLAVAVGLDKITSKPLAEAVYQDLCLAVAVLAGALLARRARWFNPGATLVLVLATYGVWALGSWLWAVPILVALAASPIVKLRAGHGAAGSEKVRATVAALLPPFLFLAARNAIAQDKAALFGPYLAALAAAVGCWIRAHSALFRAGERPALLAAVALAAALVVAVPPWILVEQRSLAALCATVGAAVVAVLGERAWSHRFAPGEPRAAWTARRFLASLAAGAVVLAAQRAGAPGWQAERTWIDPRRAVWQLVDGSLPGE